MFIILKENYPLKTLKFKIFTLAFQLIMFNFWNCPGLTLEKIYEQIVANLP